MLSCLQNYDDGTSEKQYGHALVAGIDRYPRPVTKRMGKKKIKSRSKVKPFIRVLNYNHLMPTRFEISFKFLFKKCFIFYVIVIIFTETSSWKPPLKVCK